MLADLFKCSGALLTRSQSLMISQEGLSVLIPLAGQRQWCSYGICTDCNHLTLLCLTAHITLTRGIKHYFFGPVNPFLVLHPRMFLQILKTLLYLFFIYYIEFQKMLWTFLKAKGLAHLHNNDEQLYHKFLYCAFSVRHSFNLEGTSFLGRKGKSRNYFSLLWHLCKGIYSNFHVLKLYHFTEK